MLARLAKQGDVASIALAREAGVTVDYGRPYVDRLVDRAGDAGDGVLALTPAGSGRRGPGLRRPARGAGRLLAGWSPEQHADLASMLDRLSRALMGDDADRRLLNR